MRNLTCPDSLLNRLNVWAFVVNFDDEKDILNSFHTNIMKGYEQIETNPTFISVLAYTLGIGNILNGGTNKGQADGFDLQVLGKLTSTKDNKGHTLLSFIM